jgi:hypothetical protein
VALRSALDDFETTSLGAIPGVLGKLRYLARLHTGDGNYSHWGLGRVHGEVAARRAIRASHAAVLTRVLRTPLRLLFEELSPSAESAGMTQQEFLLALETMQGEVPSERAMEATNRHLKAVLHALSALLQSQARAHPPGALPPPQSGQ